MSATIEEEEHARLGPSNHRWPHCPGSIREEERYPDTPGRAAIDGTGSHLLLELCLKEGKAAREFDRETIGEGHRDMPMGWFVQPDRIDRVQMCLDYIERRRQELTEQFPECKISVFSETKSRPGQLFFPPRADWWGTVDITIRVEDYDRVTRFLETVDYKDGRGFVRAENNTQLQSYLAGKLVNRKVPNSTPCRMTIVQPKTSPVVRYQDVSAGDIRLVAADLYARAEATDDPNAPLRAGWWCQWCKANPRNGGHCSKGSEQSIEEVKTVTADLEHLLTLDISQATEEQLALIMDQEPIMQAMFDRARKEIEARLKKDVPVRGWAFKPGRGSRRWADEKLALAALKACRLKKEEYAPSKLVSVAQAEKLVPKKKFEEKLAELVEEVQGKKQAVRVAHQEPKEVSFDAPIPVSFV